MTTSRHAEIVGAGIAGLSTAAALARSGWSVRVHERGPEVRAVGAGIYVYENGLRVLETLGAVDDAIAGASIAQKRETRSGTNALLSVHNWGATGRVYCVTRQRLVDALAAAARKAGAEIVTSSIGTGATPDGTVTFETGETAKADLVVAADGVNSRLRDGTDLLEKRRAMPDGAIRVQIEKTADERAAGDTGTTIENWSGTRRVLITPCSDTDIYLALTMLDSDTVAKAVPIDIAAWTGWFPHLKSMFERIGDAGRYDRFEYLRLKKWSTGRLAFLGDAAHAMPPNIGQGGGCAMMNGLALATHLSGMRDTIAGLAAWETRERPITEHTQRVSLMLGKPTTWPAPLQKGFHSLVGKSRWMGEMRTRTARHIPTGTA